MATRAELEAEWSTAATSGTLLTAKHDPNGLGTAWASYRTVLTPQLSASLEAFVKGGQYSVNHYRDQRYPSGPGLFEVVPSPTAGFSVVGSGGRSTLIAEAHYRKCRTRDRIPRPLTKGPAEAGRQE